MSIKWSRLWEQGQFSYPCEGPRPWERLGKYAIYYRKLDRRFYVVRRNNLWVDFRDCEVISHWPTRAAAKVALLILMEAGHG